jgi:purine-binding chemotaxis protein CheW
LRERARSLAQCSHANAKPARELPALAFTVGGERFCLALPAVAEVMRFTGCAPLWGAPPELLGVINVRGQIRSVLDLCRILGLSREGDPSHGYIVLVRHAGLEIGLRVDEVEQIDRYDLDASAAPDNNVVATYSDYVRQRTAGGRAVLDVDSLFSHPLFRPVHTARRRVPAGPVLVSTVE